MSEPERTAVRLNVDDAGKIPSIVDLYLNGSNPPDLVLLHLDSEKFPRRTMDFPEDVRKYVMTHPKVKVEWDNTVNRIVNTWDVVVSMTSFPDRFCQFDLFRKCLDSIIEQKTKYKFHFVITLFKDDIPKMSDEFINYCFRHNIEILPCQEDLKGHKKYFYVMQKYRGVPVITVDDDSVFSDNMVDCLMNMYFRDKHVIWTGWCQQLNIVNNKLCPEIQLFKSVTDTEKPSFNYKFGSGSGSVLPPHLIKDFDLVRKMINCGKIIFHDEVLLKRLSLEANIKVGFCRNPQKSEYKGVSWIDNASSFIKKQMSSLSESGGNLHKTNLTRIQFGGKKLWQSSCTEWQMLGQYCFMDETFRKDNRFVKIVVPCWNVEKSISRLLDSIMEQTCKDFFIVCIDDLSSDNTWGILQEYQSKYPYFIGVYQAPHKMYADGAREYGFGQYLDAEFTWFVDADDKLHDRNVLQKLKSLHEKQQMDVYTIDSNKCKYDLNGNCFAPWFRLVKTSKVVFEVANLPFGNDVLQTFKQLDIIPDDKILNTKICAYDYSGMHFDINKKQLDKNSIKDKFQKAISMGFDTYVWHKLQLKQKWIYWRDVHLKNLLNY